MWLNVPVEKDMAPLRDIKIKTNGRTSNVPWATYILRQVDANYKKTDYFDKYYGGLEEICSEPKDKLVDFNMDIINYLAKCFGIKTEVISFYDLPKNVNGGNASEDLANAAKAVDADIYLSGAGGKGYMNLSCFEDKGIGVIFQEYEHPIYPQRFPGFEPYMSAIDALFNIGYLPRSGEKVRGRH